MILDTDTIYQTYRKSPFLMMPSLQISEGVKVYISNKGPKPSSISEMVEDTGFQANKINSFVSIPRWIAITATSDDYEAYECGLLTNPFKDVEKYISPDESIIIDKKETILYTDNNKTFLEW